jgi:hypothetical protein
MGTSFDFRRVGGVPVYQGDSVAWDFGWWDNPVEVAAVVRSQPYASASATEAGQVAGDELPKEVFLWHAHKKITGKNPETKNQGGVGSCVSFGTNTAIRRTMAVEIAIGGEAEELTDIVEEVTYGGSRVEVGGGRIRGDGSIGAWAAEFVKKWGVIARGKYDGHDLSRYSESTCRSFGSRGVPDALEPLAREHPVKEVVAVNTTEEAKRLLASGYGIAICSDQGFSMRRDSRGVASPSGTWHHCMCIDGYVVLPNGDEIYHDENSWGPDAHTGPVGPGEPGPGGFYMEKRVLARILGQGDSWAFSALRGFPARSINWRKIL